MNDHPEESAETCDTLSKYAFLPASSDQWAREDLADLKELFH